MSVVRSIDARWILNSRGHPTVEVELTTEDGVFSSAVPSGASVGSREAIELLDGGRPFHGKGVQKAIANVKDVIAPAVAGMDPADQRSIDDRLIELDGTTTKEGLGANAVLPVSLAAARAGAAASGVPLYEHLYGGEHRLPVPFMNVINGGAHAGNDLDIQEYMLAPTGFETFSDAVQAGSEVYQTLKGILLDAYGKDAINVGDEGGFAPPISEPECPLELVLQAVEEVGYDGRISLAIDAAASEFADSDGYVIAGERRSSGEMIDLYRDLVDTFPLISLEDPFSEDDWDGFMELTKALGSRVHIIGDDIFVSNRSILERGIDSGAANAVLLKVNQIGTVSEALDTVETAYGAGYGVMVSHRSGETCDDFIGDLAVSIGCGMIKSGAPARGERTSKYNRMLRIEGSSGFPYGPVP
jgi:enolase